MTDRRNVSIDTGVFIRWVDGEEPSHAAVEKLISKGCRIVLPSPVLAEYERVEDRDTWEPHPDFLVSPYDIVTARLQGEKFPNGTLTEVKEATVENPPSRTHLKYDSMIVACALRARVDFHVAIDDDHHQLCARVNLRCYSPEQVIAPSFEGGEQTSLSLD